MLIYFFDIKSLLIHRYFNRLAELSLERGDKVVAVSQINELLSFLGKDSEYEINNRPYYLLRAYIISARARTGGSAFFMLRKALAYSLRYGYPRFRAVIQLEMAKLQVRLNTISISPDY